jgi:Gpi18-like mannosyltransferase
LFTDKYNSTRKWLKTSDYNQRGLFVCFLGLILLAICLRISFIKIQTNDYLIYVHPWTEFLKSHGLHAFKYNFANYNTPYLLLLYIGNYLHISDLFMVKIISILFDLLLAYGVYLIVGYFKPTGPMKWAAAVTLLFLPTVFINSSLWGQCDSIYTSFILFSLYNCLKDNSGKAWSFFGFALAFKLQAIFFLPFILFITFNKRWKLYAPVYAVVIFIILSCLPIFEGRSIPSTFSIYLHQTQPSLGNQSLSLNAPTFYQWLPNNVYFKQLRRGGIILTSGVALSIVSFAFRKRAYAKKELILIATISVYSIPFFMPLMHERYFYTAEVLSLVLAFVLPRLAWIAAAMQFVTILSYIPYLTEGKEYPPLPWAVLSGIVFIIMFTLVAYTLNLRPTRPRNVKPSV